MAGYYPEQAGQDVRGAGDMRAFSFANRISIRCKRFLPETPVSAREIGTPILTR